MFLRLLLILLQVLLSKIQWRFSPILLFLDFVESKLLKSSFHISVSCFKKICRLSPLVLSRLVEMWVGLSSSPMMAFSSSSFSTRSSWRAAQPFFGRKKTQTLFLSTTLSLPTKMRRGGNRVRGLPFIQLQGKRKGTQPTLSLSPVFFACSLNPFFGTFNFFWKKAWQCYFVPS